MTDKSLLPQSDEEQIAFVVVRLGKRSHLDAMVALLDVQEAIDGVEGCVTESTGAFPETERASVVAYAKAAQAHGVQTPGGP